MPNITHDQLLDYATAAGVVLLGLVTLAHAFVAFAKALRWVASLTTNTTDDNATEELVHGAEGLARALDKAASFLPRLTMGRISPAVVAAASTSHLLSGTAEYAYAAGRSRTVKIPFGAVLGTASYSPQFADGTYGFCGKLITNVGAVYVNLTPYLPTGATLTGLSVHVKPGVARATTNRMALQVYKKTGALVATQTQLGSTTYDDSGATVQDIAITGLTQVAAGESFFATLTAGSDATTNPDYFFYFTLSFLDPGPRNY